MTASSSRMVLTQLVLPRMRCEPVVHHIYSLLKLFLLLGAPIISAVSLAHFRSVAACQLDSSGFWQTPLFSRTILRALLCWGCAKTLLLSSENAVYLFEFSLLVSDSARLGEVQFTGFGDTFGRDVGGAGFAETFVSIVKYPLLQFEVILNRAPSELFIRVWRLLYTIDMSVWSWHLSHTSPLTCAFRKVFAHFRTRNQLHAADT